MAKAKSEEKSLLHVRCDQELMDVLDDIVHYSKKLKIKTSKQKLLEKWISEKAPAELAKLKNKVKKS